MAPADGTRDRFETAVRPHLDALFRTARRMTGNPVQAEEIVQEACLRAYQSFARFTPGSSFKAWIFRILVNLCIDQLRQRRSAEIIPIEACAETGRELPDPSHTADPERGAVSAGLRRAIEDAIAELAPELRAVVLMVLLEELSYAEAADSLAVSPAVVKSRLHRARLQLREKLGAHRTEGGQDRKFPSTGVLSR